MTNLKLNGQEITETFQFQICKTYDEAVELGIEQHNWKESEICDRSERLTVEIEGRDIVDIELDCIMVDAGSDDYIYFLNW